MQIYYYRVFRQECRVFPVAFFDISDIPSVQLRCIPAHPEICVRAMHGCENSRPPTPDTVKQS